MSFNSMAPGTGRGGCHLIQWPLGLGGGCHLIQWPMGLGEVDAI